MTDIDRTEESPAPEIARLRQQARDIGHDISNVIQAIIGEAELLSSETPAPAQLQETSDAIVNYASQVAVLVGKLRALGEAAEPPPAHPPPTADAATAVAEAAVSVAGKSIRRGQARARILVVEDQEPVREFIGAALVEAHYEVALADDGAKAVEAVRASDFDLILMDVHMPVMNGLVATRQIRELDGPRANVPIVGISANVPLQHVQSLLAAGMNDHFAKPFTKAALVRKVDELLAAPPHQGRPDLKGVIDMMGRPWVTSGLAKLQAQIDDAFGPEIHDTTLLASRAHALVSLAALLGFTTLAERCSVLENACKDGADHQPALAQAREAALQARLEATRLLAEV